LDSVVFPEGTTGAQLDVLARKALWKDGMNYMHGTGHGVGSFLNVHEGPHGFSNHVALEPGHVLTNEPGYYKEGEWGMRIESVMVVRKVEVSDMAISSHLTLTSLLFRRRNNSAETFGLASNDSPKCQSKPR